MTRRTYTPEQKAEAIARVLAGEEVSRVAREMNITRTAIQMWLVREPVGEAVTQVVTRENKGVTLLGLIGDYLESNLRTLSAQAGRMGERAWIEAQNTPELISAHDHLGRRLVAILDRIRTYQPAVGGDDDD